MATSKVDICNKAIGMIGSKPIVSMTEQSNNAIRLNGVYTTIRDAVLKAHAWGFASMIESLGQLSSETVIGWSYLYARPSLYLSISKVFSDDGSTNPDPVEYEEFRSPITGIAAIACNESPAYIKYTYQVDDTTLYSADFIQAFATALAAETAEGITGKSDLASSLKSAYLAIISEAKRNDAKGKNVNPTTKESTSSYEDSR